MVDIVAGDGVYRVLGVDRSIAFLVYCPVCKRVVVPDKVVLGKTHIYAEHCRTAFEVAVVSYRPHEKR